MSNAGNVKLSKNVKILLDKTFLFKLFNYLIINNNFNNRVLFCLITIVLRTIEFLKKSLLYYYLSYLKIIIIYDFDILIITPNLCTHINGYSLLAIVNYFSDEIVLFLYFLSFITISDVLYIIKHI